MANRRGGKRPWAGGTGRGGRFQPDVLTGRSRDGPPPSRPNSVINGFTMRDEARNTVSHELLWNQNTKLRQKPVLFVSAGFIDPLKDIKPHDSASEIKVRGDSDPEDTAAGDNDGGLVVAEETQTQVTATPQARLMEETSPTPQPPAVKDKTGEKSGMTSLNASSDVFFLDLQGDKTLTFKSEPEDSSSGEDVLLFRGRAAILESFPSSSSQKHRGKERNVTKRPGAVVPTPTAAETRQQVNQFPKPDRVPYPASAESEIVDDEDAILADYIANMANDSDVDLLSSQLQMLNNRDLGGDHGAFGAMSSGSEESEADGNEQDESDVEKEAIVERDDEILARMLAQQELLGIDSDGFSGPSGSYGGAGQTSAAYRPKKRHANNDSVMGAYEDLDLADWAPPAEMGPRKGRRRKQPPSFNVSDSELESALRKAWERDRERKKDRKMKRESLRAAGLLGKNASPDDLRVKYQDGMKLEDIKYELSTFLVSTVETVQFPPMDKQARKILHELATKLNIKSKSTGGGDQRRPVLFRTKRTVRYPENRYEDAEAHVEKAAARIGRSYFHRLDAKGKGPSRAAGGGGRGGHGALRYRDGEIAGGSVPELGQDNKGRTMLERMGWAKGMGLGSLDNKGILEPVAQVVKTSKAGLG